MNERMDGYMVRYEFRSDKGLLLVLSDGCHEI